MAYTKDVLVNHERHVLDNDFLHAAGVPKDIVLASPEHAAKIADIERETFDPLRYDSLLSRKTVNYWLHHANGFFLVYESEPFEAIGYAQVQCRRNSFATRFFSLAVLPRWQGKGVANSLFLSVEQVCRALGARELRLEIREDNNALLRRYTKTFGYSVFKTIPNYYPDGCGALRLNKTLC